MRGEGRITGYLFSERRAYEAMGHGRRVVHRVIHALYWGLPLWDRENIRPKWWGRFPMALWQRYRRTWPGAIGNTEHRHEFGWVTEPQGVIWTIQAFCSGCGEVGWGCTAATTTDLNLELSQAFLSKQLSALGYFTAPTCVPDVPVFAT